jgi:hypothetical protein
MENQINAAIGALKLLRSSVSNVFEVRVVDLYPCFGHTRQNLQSKGFFGIFQSTLSAQKDETTFLSELQDALSAVDTNFKNLESTVNNLSGPTGPFTLGNTAFLNHETDNERQNAYSELITGYKWYEKTHLYSAMATTMLSHNSLKRSLYSSSNKRRIVTPSAHIGENY